MTSWSRDVEEGRVFVTRWNPKGLRGSSGGVGHSVGARMAEEDPTYFAHYSPPAPLYYRV